MLREPFRRIGRPRHPDILTPVEWEVLAGVREGLSNPDIALRRGCGLETVRFHLKNLRRKLGVHGREELRAFPGRPASAIAGVRQPGRRIREQISLVAVQDMRRSLDFYVSHLGFEIVSQWPDDGRTPGWVALASGGARLMLRVGHPRRQIVHRAERGPITLSLYVEGLDSFRRDLLSAGVRCDEPETLFYGAREFFVADPDSNEVSIVEFAASDPKYMATSGDKTLEENPQ